MLPGARSPKDHMFGPDPEKEKRDRKMNDLAVYNLKSWIAKNNMAIKRRNAEIKLMFVLFDVAILALCMAWWISIAAGWHPEARLISLVPFALCILVAMVCGVALIILGRRRVR